MPSAAGGTGGHTGFTSLTLLGAMIWPPTRTGVP